MSLKYEPASEPLLIEGVQLRLQLSRTLQSPPRVEGFEVLVGFVGAALLVRLQLRRPLPATNSTPQRRNNSGLRPQAGRERARERGERERRETTGYEPLEREREGVQLRLQLRRPLPANTSPTQHLNNSGLRPRARDAPDGLIDGQIGRMHGRASSTLRKCSFACSSGAPCPPTPHQLNTLTPQAAMPAWDCKVTLAMPAAPAPPAHHQFDKSTPE